MSIVSEVLEGDGAALLLPRAYSELRKWGYPSAPQSRVQSIPVDNDWIYLRRIVVAGQPQDHIRIVMSGDAYFEFETSGRPILTQSIAQEGITFDDVYKVAVVGVGFNGKKASASILGGKRQANASTASRLSKPQQINLIDEPVTARNAGTVRTRPGLHYPKLLYDSWAPNHPHTGVMLRAYNMGGGADVGRYSIRGSLEAHTARDIGLDVPYQDSNGIMPLRSAFIRNDADWPRANGIQTVTSELHGTREFAIYVDAFNQFFVFPTAQIKPLDAMNPYLQNVDPLYVKEATPAIPTWAFVPGEKAADFYADNGRAAIVEYPELDWKLHPSGIKACAVVHERQPANFDATYYGVDQGATPLTLAAFNSYRDANTGYAWRQSATVYPLTVPQRYCIGTGLLELTLNIALTGTDPEDFTFGIDVAEIRRPTTSPYCTMIAGYVWYDIETEVPSVPKTYIADRGDLVVMDIERHYRPADGRVLSFLSVKNLTKATELRDWIGVRVVDYDMATLSFVLSQEISETVNRTLLHRPGAPGVSTVLPYVITHTAVMVTTFNRFRKMLFPETLPVPIRDQMTAQAELHARDYFASLGGPWTFMAMNDLRDWSDPVYKNLRDFYATSFGFKAGIIPTPTAPTAPLANWWGFAMMAYFAPTPLLYIAAPRFNWHLYADEIMNRLSVTPRSTFFVHPSGTWAFFDQHTIYNPYGMYGPVDKQDALTPAINEMVLEHVIYDAVHLENPNGSLDTSFIEIYNQAAVSDTLTESFDPIAKSDLRAVFTKQRHTDGSGIQWLQLRMDWYPSYVGYYPETGYQGGAYTSGVVADSGGLIDLQMGAAFYSAPDYGGSLSIPSADNTPITFASCVMVA